MTTTPVLGADKPSDETVEAMKAILFSGRVVDTFMIHDLYRAAVAAVPASEPYRWLMITPEVGNEVLLRDKAEAERFASMDSRQVIALYRAAAPVPVSGMPDLAKLMAAQREEFIRQVVSGVAEMDRDSPEDQPEMMLVTPEELRGCIESAFEYMDEEAELVAIPALQAPDTPVAPLKPAQAKAIQKAINALYNHAESDNVCAAAVKSLERHFGRKS